MWWIRPVVIVAVHLLAVGTFVASVAAHGLTYFGVDLGGNGYQASAVEGVLHINTLVAVVAAFGLGGGLLDRTDLSDVPSIFPACFVALFLYVLVNVSYWSGDAHDRVVHRPDGGIHLVGYRSGDVLREMTADEARWYLARRARSMSGHWVLFSTMAVLQLAARRWLPPVPTSASPAPALHPAGNATE